MTVVTATYGDSPVGSEQSLQAELERIEGYITRALVRRNGWMV